MTANVLSMGEVLWITGMYESITIQTRQLTIKDLNKEKIVPYGRLLRLTVNSKEDVFILPSDIKAIYGKNKLEEKE